MLKIALTVVLLVVAARAEFPFTDFPLQPSFHSNKVFFNITDLKEIAGVWNGVSTAIQQFVFEVAAEFGTPFNLTCDGWRSSGWNYDYFDLYPHAITIDVDQNHLTDGLVGNYVEADTDLVTGVTRRFGIRDYSVADGLMTLDNGGCRSWRPYFDWELGKTMLIRNYRYYYYPDENGLSTYNIVEGCVNAEVDHPQCLEGSFELQGSMHTGVILDSPVWMECIAGPCLDLPFTLDGYVQTQGYVPAWVNADGN